MLVNNPSYGLHLIDLVANFDADFEYEKLYEEVDSILKPYCKKAFFVDDDIIWNNFIERLCDRYYSRTINFDTFLDFILKMKNCLYTNKTELARKYEVSLKTIDPLITDYMERLHDGKIESKEVNTTNTTDNTDSKNELESKSKSSYDNTTKNDSVNEYDNSSHNDSNNNFNNKTVNNSSDNNKSSNNDFSYNLVSDTPADSINIENLFNNNNYVTNATNTKNNSNTESSNINNSLSSNTGNSLTSNSSNDKGKATGKTTVNDAGSTDNINNSTSNEKSTHVSDTKFDKNLEHSDIYNELEKGYHGTQVELLDKYANFTFDCINLLLDRIEEDNIFMSLLY